MNRRKILLLGGSAQQLVAIRAAKALGYGTVLCDYLPDNPGQYEVDKYYNVSTTDVEAVYNVAKSEEVGGILAYASDPAALPAAIVADRLGLPANSVKSVETLGVKHRFREFLKKQGFACPQFYAFDTGSPLKTVQAAVSRFHYPIVIKPTDSSGSKGVTKVPSPEGIAQAVLFAASYSRNKTLIAEEFIERGFPEVVGGDVFVWDGRIVLFGEMTCLRGEGGRSLIPIGEKIPGGLSAHQTEAVHSELQRLVTALDIRFGELNIEILLDADDRVYFLEVGPRAGGNMIPIELSDAYGVDLVKANVAAAMGDVPSLELKQQPGCFFTYVLHSAADGVFAGVEYSAEIKPYVYREVLYKRIGDRVEAFDGAGKAIGIVFVHVETESQMLDFCRRIESLMVAIVKAEEEWRG